MVKKIFYLKWFTSSSNREFLQETHFVKRVLTRSFSDPYSFRMRENTNQKNSEYKQFSCSDNTSSAQSFYWVGLLPHTLTDPKLLVFLLLWNSFNNLAKFVIASATNCFIFSDLVITPALRYVERVELLLTFMKYHAFSSSFTYNSIYILNQK